MFREFLSNRLVILKRKGCENRIIDWAIKSLFSLAKEIQLNDKLRDAPAKFQIHSPTKSSAAGKI